MVATRLCHYLPVASLPSLDLVFVRLLLLLLSYSTASAWTTPSDDILRALPGGGADFDVTAGPLLAPLLIPRVPGTPGSATAQRHLADFFARNLPQWTQEWHNSTSTTPATGARRIPFASLVLRRDPPWAAAEDVARLTLVAHYDSKYRPEGFVGATDSAAPCAILMHVARSVDAALTAKWAGILARDEEGDGLNEVVEKEGVQIIFLDGEEAWEEWSDSDSLYGARALAEAWEAKQHQPLATYSNPLSAISLFVLLDLLGAANPQVPAFFSTTHWAYKHLAAVEQRLRQLKLLETVPPLPFLPETGKPAHEFTHSYVQDDHVPFLQRGVDVLHIIPLPFPKVWHTMEDDAAHLDVPTIRDWAKIVTGFVAGWMELDGWMEGSSQRNKHGHNRVGDGAHTKDEL